MIRKNHKSEYEKPRLYPNQYCNIQTVINTGRTTICRPTLQIRDEQKSNIHSQLITIKQQVNYIPLRYNTI